MLDALIIGAGPAGCIAAIVLARAGRRVMLVEQHRFPRDKVCGECLSSLGIDVLRRLDLLNVVQKLQPVALTHTTLHDRRGRSRIFALPHDMWGLSRVALDQALLDAAIDAGTELMQPARCEAIQPGRLPTAAVRDLHTNRTQTLAARHMLLADGKGAMLPRRPRPTDDMGVKAHFIHVAGPRDTIELFALPGHYLGIAAIENARWNLAMSVPIRRVAQVQGNLQQLLEQLLRENPMLRCRLSNARRIGQWLAAPLPRFPVAARWPEGVVPLGNAAAALEPIGGEGMGLAMRSAEMTAHVLLQPNTQPATLYRAYRRLWSLRSAACRLTAVAISTPPLDRLARQAAAGPPLRALLRCMGK